MLRAEDYSAVFDFRKALRGEYFLLHYGATRTDEGAGAENARLGLVVGKKFMRRAVGRNVIKRAAREIFRQKRSDLPARDWVLRLTAKLPKPDRALREKLTEEILRLLTKAATKVTTQAVTQTSAQKQVDSRNDWQSRPAV